MKIGIISPYALPEKGAASMRVDSFQKYLSKKKDAVEILSPLRQENVSEKKVIRYSSFRELKKRIKKYDFLIITCPSVYTAFKLIPYLKFKKIPFLLDFRDIAENSKRKLNILFEFFSIKLSKKITTTTEFMKNYFIKKYGVSEKKIEIIPNGVDKNIFFHVPNKKQLRKKLSLPLDKKIILYEGIIGDHDLNIFLNKLSKKFIEKNNLYFILLLIVGETESKSKELLKNFKTNLKKKKILDEFKIYQNVSPEKIKNFLSAADWGLVPIPANEKNLYRMPIKVYESAICNLPVIAFGPKGGELEKFVINNNYGFFFDCWEKLFLDFENLKNKKIKHKKNILKSFDREESARKLLEFIEK